MRLRRSRCGFVKKKGEGIAQGFARYSADTFCRHRRGGYESARENSPAPWLRGVRLGSGHVAHHRGTRAPRRAHPDGWTARGERTRGGCHRCLDRDPLRQSGGDRGVGSAHPEAPPLGHQCGARQRVRRHRRRGIARQDHDNLNDRRDARPRGRIADRHRRRRSPRPRDERKARHEPLSRLRGGRERRFLP